MKEKLGRSTKVIVLVLGIMLTIIGVAYSYLAPLISGVENESTIVLNSANLTITYNGSNVIEGENIIPGWSDTKEFTVVGFNDVVVDDESIMDYRIRLIVLENTFSDGAIKYELTGSSTNVNDTLAPLSGKLATGFGSTTLGTARFSQDDNIKNGVTHTYKLTISFPNDPNKNQSDDWDKSFSGYVIIEEGELQLTLSNYIANKYKDSEETFTDDNNDLRFKYSATSNYISFNDETWRILGLYENEDYDDNGNSLGTTSKKVKIIKSESIGQYAWDTDGNNNWENASLQIYLNNDYYDSLSLNKDMIAVSKWENGYTPYPWTWIGKIAIISEEEYCPEAYDYENRYCKYLTNTNINNWLKKSNQYKFGWLLDDYINYAAKVFKSNMVYKDERSNNKYWTENFVFPTLYLKSDILITGGNGSSSNPFELSLNIQ